MVIESTKAIDTLTASYNSTLPLLNYLKARLKYDTVRWIRTYGTKDDIVFSTRIKTFDRVFDKLLRKGVTLADNSDLLEITLSGRRILDDLIGIRFICFDAFQIYELARYFLITERVTTAHREFYVSSKADRNHPIYRYLQSNGFTAINKEGREYEDINFIMRFSHPIDKYFQSGLEKFDSLAQRAGPSPVTEKLAAVNALFDVLRNESPHLIGAISQMPIECQIVTATQHIYNRTQRPHYEYFLQAKGASGGPAVSPKDAADLTDRLDVLKLSLLAVDKNVFSIHKQFGIRYEPHPQINPGPLFELEGRLPKDILEENHRLERINTSYLATVIAPESTTLKRKIALVHILEDIEAIDKKIAERAEIHMDIAPGKLLHIADLKEISHPEIVFWSFQRVTILVICVMLLYAHDEIVLSEMIGALRFGGDKHKLTDVDIVLGRLFEHVEHVDNAVHAKIVGAQKKISNWRDGYFSSSAFSDPLVQWRYASFMYSKREYDNALQEMKVGIAIHAQLNDWKKKGVAANFSVPEAVLFTRRSVEYELCAEISKLKTSPVAIAGVVELYHCVLSHSDEWHSKLEIVFAQVQDVSERARCVCFQILFRLCALSARGSKGPMLSTIRNEFAHKFDDVDKSIVHHGQNEIRERTWWFLARSVIEEENSDSLLQRFYERSKEIVHHPLERKQFEEACATLIRLWKPKGTEIPQRNDFAINTLALLRDQTEQIAKSDAISQAAIDQSTAVATLLTEILRELRDKGKIESHDGIKKKLADLAGDAVEHVFINTTVAALRSLLGI